MNTTVYSYHYDGLICRSCVKHWVYEKVAFELCLRYSNGELANLDGCTMKVIFLERELESLGYAWKYRGTHNALRALKFCEVRFFLFQLSVMIHSCYGMPSSIPRL